jgi:hypothetical protein
MQPHPSELNAARAEILRLAKELPAAIYGEIETFAGDVVNAVQSGDPDTATTALDWAESVRAPRIRYQALRALVPQPGAPSHDDRLETLKGDVVRLLQNAPQPQTAALAALHHALVTGNHAVARTLVHPDLALVYQVYGFELADMLEACVRFHHTAGSITRTSSDGPAIPGAAFALAQAEAGHPANLAAFVRLARAIAAGAVAA